MQTIIRLEPGFECWRWHVEIEGGIRAHGDGFNARSAYRNAWRRAKKIRKLKGVLDLNTLIDARG